MRCIKFSLALLVFSLFLRVASGEVFYIDPQSGSDDGDGSFNNPWKALSHVVEAGLIESRSYVLPYDPGNPQLMPKNAGSPVKAGDTLMLYGGLHGELFLVNYINAEPITIMAVPGEAPVLKRVHLQAGKNWRLEGLQISSEPYGIYINNKLVFLESHNWQGPVDNIEIKNCYIYSTENPWTTAEAWVNKASDGIVIWGDSVKVLDNTLFNVGFGITMSGDYIQAVGNVIENFSQDGMRIGGSFQLVEANVIKNCYDVDDNHDDGIQSFTTGGLVVDNNIVRRNIILNFEDPEQPLLGALQGIGCFDGFYNNWVVENNLIVVDHWHGIAFYGAHNCLIANNTVLDPSPETTPGPAWIKIEDLNGEASTACVIANNVTNSLQLNAATEAISNVILLSAEDYNANFVNYTDFDFHLLGSSDLIDAANATYAPELDLDGNLRTAGGALPDVGAYEYIPPVGVKQTANSSCSFTVFPNPVFEMLYVQGPLEEVRLVLMDASGRVLLNRSKVKLPLALPMRDLPDGLYFLELTEVSGNGREVRRVVKNTVK